MLILDNIATQDEFAEELTLEQDTADTVTYVVANASAYAQFRPVAARGGAEPPWGPPVLLTPSSNTVRKVSGVKFRSVVAGEAARVVAFLLGPGDPQIIAGIPFPDTLAPSGQIIADTMTDYTPIWSTTANPQPSLMDGILLGRYAELGPLVFVKMMFQAGPNTTFGAGLSNFTIPIAPVILGGFGSVFLGQHGLFYDSSANIGYEIAWREDGYMDEFTGSPAQRTPIGNGVPVPWAAGDIIAASLLYAKA